MYKYSPILSITDMTIGRVNSQPPAVCHWENWPESIWELMKQIKQISKTNNDISINTIFSVSIAVMSGCVQLSVQYLNVKAVLLVPFVVLWSTLSGRFAEIAALIKLTWSDLNNNSKHWHFCSNLKIKCLWLWLTSIISCLIMGPCKSALSPRSGRG